MSNGVKIFVTARPSALKESIEKIDETHFIVAVSEPPVQGRANRAIIRALSAYFNVKPYQVELISGKTSKTKVLKIRL